METIRVINLILFIGLVVLGLNAIGPSITGAFVAELNPTDFECVFHNNGDVYPMEPYDCCYALQASLTCTHDGTAYTCTNREGSSRYYIANAKQAQFCSNEGFDVSFK